MAEEAALEGRRGGPRTRAKAVALVAASAVWLGPTGAAANGRFPRAERLLEDPTNPDRLVVAATYGLVTTPDRGAHWYHTCESAFAGDPMYSGDPVVELVAGGAALADVQSFVGRSPDLCAWSPVLRAAGADAGAASFIDIALDVTRSHVVAIEERLVDGGSAIGLQWSDDAGLTWRRVGGPLPAGDVFSVDLDPADARHVVATGLSPAHSEALFFSSSDGGSTWSSWPIPQAGPGAFPYIAALDPHRPGVVYVRTDAWVLPPGADQQVADDALLVSSDGGRTWTKRLEQAAKLLGFALSPDGRTVLAGYGDPVDAAYTVDPTATGIYAAAAPDGAFARVSASPVTCLTWTARGMYACLQDETSGSMKELALFDSVAAVDAGSPHVMMRLADIVGPPPCCPAVAVACPWQTVCPALGRLDCGDEAGAPPPAIACMDAGAGGPTSMAMDSGGPPAGGTTSTMGTGSSDAASPRGPAAGPGAAPAMHAGHGCDVGGGAVARAAGRDRVGWDRAAAVALAGVLAMFVARRRRGDRARS